MSWDQCLINNQIPTLACLEVIIGKLVSLSSWLFLTALFVMIVIGAYKYLTAFGSEDKMSQARSTLKFAFIGLIIYLGAFLIIRIIGYLFLENPETLWNINLINPQTSE
ncbi:MAG: hypothetical protein KatS3mg090_0585 [Patescibacteria group bacterium]|nr:MAG: hypothetical protein KatS3mg090_0585 [Patescibacteria group bacterium]